VVESPGNGSLSMTEFAIGLVLGKGRKEDIWVKVSSSS
jgi:hypothetical protein